MTQGQLSEKFGLRRVAIAKLETGVGGARLDGLWRLAKAPDVSSHHVVTHVLTKLRKTYATQRQVNRFVSNPVWSSEPCAFRLVWSPEAGWPYSARQAARQSSG